MKTGLFMLMIALLAPSDSATQSEQKMPQAVTSYICDPEKLLDDMAERMSNINTAIMTHCEARKTKLEV